ncbi:hypothetical protein K227x_30660 [Rubripirellula lacrimiformis]|uniref:Aerotolerance regulator N-terminal domain-containing protein n=1 Tax=Rubripirellula lacrimiformis TaxID=1930273 RepID=A0A517NC11_9BACT|nr:BatA domain-containing protein [Rubripirellula lacrimiformis]QDT04672.1 hypothetical protein K227x_30660 [Rubripirellula lacrimiformis]
MTFLNGLLAFGAFASIVPLAIHLLFRSRYRTVDWGAMHLLDSVVRINRRRIQWMNLLLLLLRCLLPILLAFCLARPVLTGFQSLPGTAPRSIVILVDDSRSMQAKMPDGQPRFDFVKRRLTSWLDDLSRTDELALIRASDVEGPVGWMGANDAAALIHQMRADSGPVELGDLLRRGVQASQQASHAEREILFVSDFQSHLLDDAAIQSFDTVGEGWGRDSVRPLIHFLNLGVQSDQMSNVSVDEIESESPAVVAGRTAKFSARIRNASDVMVQDLRVIWSIDGTPFPARTITIAPRSSATVQMSGKLADVGVHSISVAVEHADSLPGDNRRWIGVDVIRQVNVLMVDGSPSRQPLKGEVDFLAVALSPFAFGGQDQPDAVRTSICNAASLEQRLDKEVPDVVVMANVRAINDRQRDRLAGFVNGGGAIVIFDGDLVVPATYNQPWGQGDEAWQLPARMGDVVVAAQVKDSDQRFVINQINRLYSPWSIIQDDASTHSMSASGASGIGGIEVTQYRKLVLPNEPPSSDSGSDSVNAASSLMSFVSGDPVVVSAPRGRGRVVQIAITSDSDWSNFPTRLVYLPMLQQLILDLAGSRMQTTIDVGTPINVPVSELVATLSAKNRDAFGLGPGTNPRFDDGKSAAVTIEKPDGKQQLVSIAGDTSSWATLGIADVPGVYRIRLKIDGAAGSRVAPVPESNSPKSDKTPSTDRPSNEPEPMSSASSTIRVAQVASIESQLRDADPSRLTRAAEAVDASVYQDLDSMKSADHTRRFGREIWRWLLLALLVAMIGELFLQQRSPTISHHASSNAPQSGAWGSAS